MDRDELDRRMRVVLNELRLCSHVPAASAGGGGSASGKDASRGGRRPPGDLGATEYERAYGPPFALETHRSAKTDRDRERVMHDAESERDHLRGHAERRQVQGETHEQLVQRMLVEARGMTPEAVATTSFRMLAREIRKHRLKAGLHPETGASPSGEHDAKAERHGPGRPAKDSGRMSTNERRARVADLDDEGMPMKSIALRLGVDKATISRDLEALRGRRAA